MAERVYGDGRYLVEIVPNVGPYGNNAYILSGPNRGSVTIVDAPEGAEAILEAVGRRRIERIVVTHSHFDHWGGFDVLRAATDAPVYAGAEETDVDASREVKRVAHGATFDIGGATARVLHTPGHTPGSICLHFGGAVLTGDTLFPGGPGRTRTNEALQQEIASIKQHLLQLQPDTVVLPGHGGTTTIAKAAEEYAVFAGKEHPADLSGDVLWLDS
ncbi:MAG: MBL fold metallo-hydrolase [Chloroflexi bacterium]|nr:MBL fold metallo-hydrolase [Chloroflexota bacterium]